MSRISRHRKVNRFPSMFSNRHFENQVIRDPKYFHDNARMFGKDKTIFLYGGLPSVG